MNTFQSPENASDAVVSHASLNETKRLGVNRSIMDEFEVMDGFEVADVFEQEQVLVVV